MFFNSENEQLALKQTSFKVGLRQTVFRSGCTGSGVERADLQGSWYRQSSGVRRRYKLEKVEPF